MQGNAKLGALVRYLQERESGFDIAKVTDWVGTGLSWGDLLARTTDAQGFCNGIVNGFTRAPKESSQFKMLVALLKHKMHDLNVPPADTNSDLLKAFGVALAAREEKVASAAPAGAAAPSGAAPAEAAASSASAPARTPTAASVQVASARAIAVEEAASMGWSTPTKVALTLALAAWVYYNRETLMEMGGAGLSLLGSAWEVTGLSSVSTRLYEMATTYFASPANVTSPSCGMVQFSLSIPFENREGLGKLLNEVFRTAPKAVQACWPNVQVISSEDVAPNGHAVAIDTAALHWRGVGTDFRLVLNPRFFDVSQEGVFSALLETLSMAIHKTLAPGAELGR